jgi:hypothetical protein
MTNQELNSFMSSRKSKLAITPTLPVREEVKHITQIKDCTPDDYTLSGELIKDFYDLMPAPVEKRIVGMESVEWWEYVLIYGVFKALKIATEYQKVKAYIDKPVIEYPSTVKQKLRITLTPRKRIATHFEYPESSSLSYVKKITREFDTLTLDIPIVYSSRIETREEKKGYFLYDVKETKNFYDKVASAERAAKILQDRGVHNTFTEMVLNAFKNV